MIEAFPRPLAVTIALDKWRGFLRAYAVVEPGNAMDLTGDPPIYIAILQREQSDAYARDDEASRRADVGRDVPRFDPGARR